MNQIKIKKKMLQKMKIKIKFKYYRKRLKKIETLKINLYLKRKIIKIDLLFDKFPIKIN